MSGFHPLRTFTTRSIIILGGMATTDSGGGGRANDFSWLVGHEQRSHHVARTARTRFTQRKVFGRVFAQDTGGNYVRDWISGGIDGTITTFAIIAGVVGADLPGTVVLVLGLANLVADGFAMGAGNYSATKADVDDYSRLIAIERKHILLEPGGEREEVRQIFELKGFSGDKLKERIIDVITSDENLWARTMAVEEYGLSPAAKSPLQAALNTSAAFVLCGLVPLISYLIAYSLGLCVVATGLVFFAIGAAKEPMVAGRLGEVRAGDVINRDGRGRSSRSSSASDCRAFIKVPI